MNKSISFMQAIDHPGWEKIKASSELLHKSAVMFALSLIPAVRQAAVVMSEFGRCIEENGFLNDDVRLPGNRSFGRLGEEFCARMRSMREDEYLQHHARMPVATMSPVQSRQATP